MALRQKIGVEALMKLFQSYFAMFKDNNAATQDFIDLAEKISRQELSDFFNAWLYEDVVPEIK